MNQYETQLMTEGLLKEGFEIVHHSENADIYIVNSCTVTAVSNSKTRQAVRSFKRNHPNALVVLCGCMSQTYPRLGESLSEADIVIGNTEHKNIGRLINEFLSTNKRIIKIDEHAKNEAFESGTINTFNERTRAIVKIEDGCNRFCSYCAIPYARGRVRSKPMEEIQKEVSSLAESGYKEIVLVGINLSAYNDDGRNIADAVHTVCSVNEIMRVRLGSLEPDHITDSIINRLAAEEKFCPQFHISLQSGCDKTLRNMNRHYTACEYTELCRKLRNVFDGCTLTTDIMVGFPGESEEDFKESLEFAKKIKFEKAHIFPYSVREGTKAALMNGQIEKHIKTERARIMSSTCEKIRNEFLKSQTGKMLSVLFEQKGKDGFYEGYTKNYIPVKIKSEKNLCGKILEVKIKEFDGNHCIGAV